MVNREENRWSAAKSADITLINHCITKSVTQNVTWQINWIIN
jgi:hypothetical protein